MDDPSIPITISVKLSEYLSWERAHEFDDKRGHRSSTRSAFFKDAIKLGILHILRDMPGEKEYKPQEVVSEELQRLDPGNKLRDKIRAMNPTREQAETLKEEVEENAKRSMSKTIQKRVENATNKYTYDDFKKDKFRILQRVENGEIDMDQAQEFVDKLPDPVE